MDINTQEYKNLLNNPEYIKQIDNLILLMLKNDEIRNYIEFKGQSEQDIMDYIDNNMDKLDFNLETENKDSVLLREDQIKEIAEKVFYNFENLFHTTKDKINYNWIAYILNKLMFKFETDNKLIYSLQNDLKNKDIEIKKLNESINELLKNKYF